MNRETDTLLYILYILLCIDVYHAYIHTHFCIMHT